MLKDTLTLVEGRRHTVYDDATGLPIVAGTLVKGNPSIGIGRDLVSNPLSDDEIDYLYKNDEARILSALGAISWFPGLPPGVKDAVANMAFNLGFHGMLDFHETIACLAAGDGPGAAAKVLDSDAARELPGRYAQIAAAFTAWQ